MGSSPGLGSCQLSGTAAFTPALTMSARSTVQDIRLTGSCSGTIAGQNLQAAPVTVTATEYAPSDSCTAGNDTGTGILDVNGRALSFTIAESRIAGAVIGNIAGAGWSATAIANIDPSHAVDVEKCLAGGLQGTAIDANYLW